MTWNGRELCFFLARLSRFQVFHCRFLFRRCLSLMCITSSLESDTSLRRMFRACSLIWCNVCAARSAFILSRQRCCRSLADNGIAHFYKWTANNASVTWQNHKIWRWSTRSQVSSIKQVTLSSVLTMIYDDYIGSTSAVYIVRYVMTVTVRTVTCKSYGPDCYGPEKFTYFSTLSHDVTTKTVWHFTYRWKFISVTTNSANCL